MYRYETHLHTYPVSGCATVSVRETLENYKALGYDGVFITNHFLCGNLNIDRSKPYAEKIDFYFSDYEKGLELSEEIGIKVFCGVELSYGGTDFLVYGLDKAWYLNNPDIMDMTQSDKLKFLMDNGAFIVQAHPYREATYIDHIRLFPRSVHAVEVINGTTSDLANKMAKLYAENYDLCEVAGTDNHNGNVHKVFAGVECETPINSVSDYISKVKNKELKIFEVRK